LPEQMDQYAKKFHSSFVGLGGDEAAIALAAKAFYVGYANLGNGEVMHNSQVTLLDRDSRMRLIYPQDKLAGLTDDLGYILAAKE
jgi:protein SCO1